MIVYVEPVLFRYGVLHPVPVVVGVGAVGEPPMSDVAVWGATVVLVHCTLVPIGIEIADGLKQNVDGV